MNEAEAQSGNTTQSAEGQAVAVASDVQNTTQQGSGSSGPEGVSVKNPVDNVIDINSYEDLKSRIAGGLKLDSPEQAKPKEGEEGSQKEVESTENKDGAASEVPEGAAKPEGEVGEGDGEGDGDGDEENEGGSVSSQQGDGEKTPQFRFRPTDKLDEEAFRIYKAAQAAHSPIGMTAAIEIAKKNLGIADGSGDKKAGKNDGDGEGDGEGEGDEGGSDPLLGVTEADVLRDIKELKATHAQKLREGDLEGAADAFTRLDDSETLLVQVRERDAANKKDESTKANTIFQQSTSRASELFPDYLKPGSEFHKKCGEIDAAFRETEDPRYTDPDKPLMIARIAARELGVVPRTTKPEKKGQEAASAAKPRQTQSSTPPRAETVKPLPLPSASGSARAASPTGGEDVVKEIQGVNTPEALEEMKRKLLSSRR